MPETMAVCAVRALIRQRVSWLSVKVEVSSGLNSGVMGGDKTPISAWGTTRMISTGRWWQTWMTRPDRVRPLARWASSSREIWARMSASEGGGPGTGSG